MKRDICKIYLDEYQTRYGFCIKGPCQCLYFDSFSWVDAYAIENFRWNVSRGFWRRLFNLDPKPWAYFNKNKSYECVEVKIQVMPNGSSPYLVNCKE